MRKKNNKRKIWLSLFLVTTLFFIAFSDVNSSSYAEKSTTLNTRKYSGFVKKSGKIYYYSPKTGKKLTGFRTIKGEKY
ncbi:hypothetical protein, partial [Terrisporobacter glycolicus]